MTTKKSKNERIAKYVEQLEMLFNIEFIYGDDLYAIEATYTKTGDHTYRSDGRGFEIWKFKDRAESGGSVIAFTEKAADILRVACFDGKTFVEIMDKIKST